jgi:Flp pilus assembly protein TadG
MRRKFVWQRRDERGISTILMSVGCAAFLAATTLAIDVGMFMVARSQAQNAADAGALAGATALVFNSYTDRSTSGPAVQGAISTAQANMVMNEAPSIGTADVTFPNDPTGQPTRVQVQVFRTAGRSNAIPTLMGAFFGVSTVDMTAGATGEASPANAMTCVRPFTIPDRWVENRNPAWTTASTFDRYYTNGPNKGQVMSPADAYPTATDPAYDGYRMPRDIGLLLTLRAGTGNNIEPTMYYSWSMPSNTGADDYRGNISGCNPTVVHQNDPITQEPGDMVGPTNEGIDDLIAQDPNAYWDAVCNCVKGSAVGASPRVFPIPLFDPDYYQSGKVNGRNATLKVANWIGFFVVQRVGNNITGRITPVLGILDPNAGPAPAGAFPRAIRLVQ